jgi:hypothetical protein
MDRAALRSKIFWGMQERWHLRHHPTPHDLSVTDTVKGLQALLLADQAALLTQTLQCALARPVTVSALERLDIVLFQEGLDQRVWRAQATLQDGTWRPFGLIAARTPEASSRLTQQDFRNLQILHARQPQYCVAPYVCGTMPLAGGVAAYSVEWLDDYKELVFEMTRHGGSFLVNTPGAQRVFSLQESRQIWRRMVEILWWYPGLRRLNIQAGDFVGRLQDNGRPDLKLTTAREFTPDSTSSQHLDTILRSVITASGYLSDGRHPFDRHLSQAAFLHRMHAILQRRFGANAATLAQQQWTLFQQGAFAQQEDWLKHDCILGTYDRFRAASAAPLAWQQTCQIWTAYAQAVDHGSLPASWWFAAAEIPTVLQQVASQHGIFPSRGNVLPTAERTASGVCQEGEHHELRKNHPRHQ